MSEPDLGRPGAGEPPEPSEHAEPSERAQPHRQQGPPKGTEPSEHDPAGLGLARATADSVRARSRRTRRTRRPGQRGSGRAERSEPGRSGAHPDERDPKLLSEALDRLVDSKGWGTELGVQLLLARWPVLVGPVNADHSHPESYADGLLTVRTESTTWATSLRTMAPQLVATLNAQLGEGTVTRVKVVGPQAPSWKKGRLSVRDGRGPRDTYG